MVKEKNFSEIRISMKDPTEMASRMVMDNIYGIVGAFIKDFLQMA